MVAGGHPATARAGAELLRVGGNAADAAVGMVAAAACAEACLTGLGGGGFALVREPGGHAEILDFFVTAPGLGRTPEDLASRAHIEPYVVPFRSTTQTFYVGPASCAVPGIPLGLTTLHARHGRLSLERVLAPAVRLARAGALVVPQQDYLHDILEGILTREEGMRRIFTPDGYLVRSGEVLRSPDLAVALERLGAEGAEPFTHGVYAQRMAEYLDRHGGLITLEDLAAYEVIIREPVVASYRGHEILTNPLPSSGGTLIAFSLGLLDRADLSALDEVGRAVAVISALEATDEVRVSDFDAQRGMPGFATAFLSPANLDRHAADLRGAGGPVRGGAAAKERSLLGGEPGNTTHVCAIDADGMSVSLTTSCGAGSGVIVDGTGIYLNNMMGEEDLNPGGFFTLPPGERLTSMMAPTIAWGRKATGEERLVALGSAGSARLRSAIVQVLVNVLDGQMEAAAAVDVPRAHVDAGTVHLEAGTPADVETTLRLSGRTVQAWSARDLYFGGVQMVSREGREAASRFDGAGDPRRGGAALLV